MYTNLISWLQMHQFPCMSRQLLGLDCPICGFQRSLLLLFKGQVADSFMQYPPLIPILLLSLFSGLFLLKKTPEMKRMLTTTSVIVLAIIAINYTISLVSGHAIHSAVAHI